MAGRWVVGAGSHAHVPRRGPGGLAGYSVFRPGRGLAGKLLNCRSPRVCNVFRFAGDPGSIPVGPRGRRHPLHPQRPRRQDAGRGRTAAAFGSVCRCCQPVPGARDATRGVVFEEYNDLACGTCGRPVPPRRGGKTPVSRQLSCAFSMPPARIGRPAPAGRRPTAIAARTGLRCVRRIEHRSMRCASWSRPVRRWTAWSVTGTGWDAGRGGARPGPR